MILYIGIFYNNPAHTPKPCTLVAAQLAKRYTLLTVPHSKSLLQCTTEVVSTLLANRGKAKLAIIDLYAYRWYHLAITSARICSALKIPFAFFLHSHLLTQKLQQKNKTLVKLLQKSVVNICPSAFFHDQLRQHGIQSTVIPNPLQSDLYTFIQQQQPQTPKLLWVRNVHPKYNPEMAIAVLQKLLLHYPDASLTLVGPFEPEYKKHLDEKIKTAGLQNNIAFTGLLKTAEWLPLATTHNIFINTTTLDNAPVSVMEAAALGLPVVSTNVGGIPQLMENEKEILLVESNDADGMTNQIVRLLKEPGLYQKLATQARNRAERNMWPQVQPLWDQLLSEFTKPTSV